jgi:hypothetical protein
MVDERKDAFLIKKMGENSWEVDMEGNKVIVATKSDAELVALIPVEINKTYSNTPGNPDISIVKKIIEVCDIYRINTFAIRRLKALLKDNQR